MNRLQRLLIKMGLESALEKQADEIVVRCAPDVADRLNPAAVSSISEARGYIRARAAVIVRRRVAEVYGLATSQQNRLHDMVTAKISQRLAAELLNSPSPAALPLQPRKAA